MAKPSQSARYIFSLVLILALFVGWVVEQIAWSLALSLLVWSLLQLHQLKKLSHWLEAGLDQDPPEAQGEWGYLFDNLYRVRRKRIKRETKLLNEIDRFKQFSAALKDAAVIIDQHGNMQWWNLSAERLLGLREKSDQDMPLFNIMRDPSFIRYCKHGNFEEPLLQPSPHNPNIQLQYSLTPFGESEKLLVAKDITDLMRLEQTRQDFVANASHELRTPLTVIRGYLETFLDLGNLAPPVQKAMQQMQQQSDRMQSLVEDLLTLSRLDSTEIHIDDAAVDVSSLTMTILSAAKLISKDKNHNISVDIAQNIGLIGREKELHSAFSNLLYNALRYTQAGGEIQLKWTCDSNGGCFSVTDNGPGISSIHLDRITERFYRVDDDRSAHTGGSGLGLAIVKHVLVRHQGYLEIKSKPGEGSTFSCHFPLETLVEL